MNSEKGISLYITLVVMVALMGIGIGVSTLLIRQATSFREVGDSVLAFYAADGGVERILQIDTCIIEEVEADRLTCVQAAISNGAFTHPDCLGEPIADEVNCRKEAVLAIDPGVFTLPNLSSYELIIMDGGAPCPGANYCGESKGTFQNSTRKVEVSR